MAQPSNPPNIAKPTAMPSSARRAELAGLAVKGAPSAINGSGIEARPDQDYWWSMIFSENRYPLFGIML
jgi:hypothetical protein